MVTSSKLSCAGNQHESRAAPPCRCISFPSGRPKGKERGGRATGGAHDVQIRKPKRPSAKLKALLLLPGRAGNETLLPSPSLVQSRHLESAHFWAVGPVELNRWPEADHRCSCSHASPRPQWRNLKRQRQRCSRTRVDNHSLPSAARNIHPKQAFLNLNWPPHLLLVPVAGTC